MPISLLILKTLYPVPEKLIKTYISEVTRVVVVEMNLGQYVREIQRLAGETVVSHYGQMDGELISPEKIREVIGS
jgi:2-oxoglutarate ferredoxin oxidoreductase subunit alpha